MSNCRQEWEEQGLSDQEIAIISKVIVIFMELEVNVELLRSRDNLYTFFVVSDPVVNIYVSGEQDCWSVRDHLNMKKSDFRDSLETACETFIAHMTTIALLKYKQQTEEAYQELKRYGCKDPSYQLAIFHAAALKSFPPPAAT